MLDCSNYSINATKPPLVDVTDNCALFDFVVYTVLGGSLVLLGLAGNMLSYMMLWYDSGKTATIFLLRCMSIVDSLVLITAVPLYVLPSLSRYTGIMSSYTEIHTNLVHFLWALYLMPYTCTILLTVLVSINRYFCVCKPFSSTMYRTRENAHRHVSYVALFSIIYNIPRFFEYQKIEMCVGYNESQEAFSISEFGKNRMYRIIYANFLYFLVMHGGPLVSLAFLNTQLMLALRRRRRKRIEILGKKPGTCITNGDTGSNGGGGGGGNQDVTFVLVVVVCVFILCQTPTFLDHLFWTFLDESKRHCGNWHYYYTAIGDLLVILNSSVNFLIYTITSHKFRQNLSASCTTAQTQQLFEHVAMTTAQSVHTQTTRVIANPNPEESEAADRNHLLEEDCEKEPQATKV